jgi:uncharacterized protein YjbI with pentapeptide repeats
MANQEQLELLKAGVEGWNKWRKKNFDTKIDLIEADLSRANLSRANLSRASLNGANFSRADLIKVDLSEAYLNRANLSGVNLDGANLNSARLIEANLYGANLNNADLKRANLRRADLTKAYLYSADLSQANLNEANLDGANLLRANLIEAKLIGANLYGVNAQKANLQKTNFAQADLTKANLKGVNFLKANLSEANLNKANLDHANFVLVNINNAVISESNIYGINVWDLKGEFKEQKELIITPRGESIITVENIKVAQFIYLLLNNKEIRDVINTLTSKTVLILGRFAIPERKAILDSLRNKLREYNLLPIVFDFDRPVDKDFTETIKTLAGISYFVIADVTNPKSSPLELQAIIPDYQIPFVPILQEGELPFAMMVDLQKKYNWVLDTISYDTVGTLIEILKPYIIDPAIKKRDELRIIKASLPTVISGKDLLIRG